MEMLREERCKIEILGRATVYKGGEGGRRKLTEGKGREGEERKEDGRVEREEKGVSQIRCAERDREGERE